MPRPFATAPRNAVSCRGRFVQERRPGLGKSPTSFSKRQREQAKKEHQRLKAERKALRKTEAGENPSSSEGGPPIEERQDAEL
jgi:hypothetical protein